jgi:hypothetical protein
LVDCLNLKKKKTNKNKTKGKKEEKKLENLDVKIFLLSNLQVKLKGGIWH